MKKLFATLFVLFIGLSVQAQNKVVFSGEVRDTLGVPLEFANVLALDTVTNKMAGFGVTNRQGQFKLSLEKDKVYKLQVSFIGFLPFERVFSLEESNSVPARIELKSDVTALEDIEVVSEMPVLIQGDTITYKTDVFTQGNERKLGDVLEDLPGFEVDDEGGVKIQGKSVNKVLVDGKEFFDGDTKLATKNLPGKVVDKVQVLQNFNDVSPLSGVNNSEQIALNIQLKEDQKNIVFGDITAGAGPEERYLAKANTFFYNQKTNINLIAGANNIGELTFSMRDYFRFTGGMGNFSRGSGSNFNVTSNSLGIPFAERNSAQNLDNQIAALNFNFTPSRKWSYSGFAIGSKVDNTLGSVQDRTYVLQPNLGVERLTSEQRVQSTSGLFKFGTKFTPNLNLQIDYSGFAKISDIRNSDNQNSTFGNVSNQISGLNTQEPIQIDQQVRGFYAPNEKDVYSFEASYQYQNQDPLYNLVNTGRPFAGILPTTGGSPFDLTQQRDITSHKQEAVFNYYRILNKTNHINFKIGNTYTSQDMTSSIFESFPDETKNTFGDASLNNLVDYGYENYYLSVLFKSKFGDLVVTPSLNLNNYRFRNTQNGIDTDINKTLLLPALNARYAFRSSHSITLNYNVTAQFSDIQNVAEGIIMRGYNSLFAGNANLENSLYHQFSLNYVNFNMYNFLNVFGGANYSLRYDDVTNVVDFSNFERINNPININTTNESLTGYASIDKRFNGFRLSGKGNWTRSVSNNIISDIANENVNFAQTYDFTFSTTLMKSIYLDLGYQVSLNSYEGRNIKNKFENHAPNASVSIEFLKGFTFDVDYRYNSYVRQNSPTTTFDIFDAELKYRKEGSAWEFRVEGMNLMNTTGIRRDSFSDSLISTYEYFIQKRYWLFSVMYDL